jgi:hypothetical protein
MGIEPTLSAWKAEVLPLNYTRMYGVSGGFRTHDFQLRRLALYPLSYGHKHQHVDSHNKLLGVEGGT